MFSPHTAPRSPSTLDALLKPAEAPQAAAPHRSLTLSLLILTTGVMFNCTDCGSHSGSVDKVVDSGDKTPTPIKEAECLTGQHLGNGAALMTPSGQPHFGVALFGADTILSINASGEEKRLPMASRPLGGLYAAGKGLLALEFGGDRLFKLTFEAGHLARDAEVSVCDTPRLAELDAPHAHAFILCRDPRRRLARVALDTLQVTQITFPGSTPADLALSHKGDRLFVANLASNDLTPISTDTLTASERISVGPEPYRLIKIPRSTGRMALLHANSRLVTLIDTDEAAVSHTAELPHTPSQATSDDTGSVLFALSAGAGRLIALDVDSLEVIHAIDVPVGTHDLAWSPTKTGSGKLLLSTGGGGELWIVNWRDNSLSIETKAHLGASAGRISPSPSPGQAWLTGPSAGRVARYRVD